MSTALKWLNRQHALVVAAAYILAILILVFIPWGVSGLSVYLTGSTTIGIVVYFAVMIVPLWLYTARNIEKNRKKDNQVNYYPPTRFPDG